MLFGLKQIALTVKSSGGKPDSHMQICFESQPLGI